MEDGHWLIQDDLSDEFNASLLNDQKWDNDVGDWGPWSWEPYNAYVQDSLLHVRMEYNEHQRGGVDLYYKSGIVRSRTTAQYGYFEASIKGCSQFPGASPAFWMKGNVGREYSEIDFIEIQQSPDNGVKRIDMNLHARVVDSDGNENEYRPNSAPELCKHFWEAPWDPRDTFHIYACESRPDSIFWIIDGVVRAKEINKYWHLPQYVMLSMGLRPPHVKWIDGDRFPVPEEATQNGFPTEMLVDYIRVWLEDDIRFHRPSQIYLAGDEFEVELEYSAAINREVSLDIFDSEDILIGSALKSVGKGMGSISLDVQTSRRIEPGQYIVLKAGIRETGGTPEGSFALNVDTVYISDGAEVSIAISDVFSHLPIVNAKVEFGDRHGYTDETGIVDFQDLAPGEYLYTIEAAHYTSVTDRVLNVYQNENIEIRLDPYIYEVSFFFQEEQREAPLLNIPVEIDGKIIYTGFNGNIQQSLPYGSYDFFVDLYNFQSASGTFNIQSDTTIVIPVKRSAADLGFRIYDGLDLLEGVEITLSDSSSYTNEDGMVLFQGVNIYEDIEYSISKDGYIVLTGDVFITADTLLVVHLIQTNLEVKEKSSKSILFPNPACDFIIIRDFHLNSEIKCYSMEGKLQNTPVVASDPLIIDITGLQNGIYAIDTDNGKMVRFIKDKQ